jgi:hypothetical protein
MSTVTSLLTLLIPFGLEAAPSMLSLDRLAGGVLTSGVQEVTLDSTSTSFVPGVFFSYSLAENLSASTSYQYYVGDDDQEVRAGLRLITTGTETGDRLQIAIGGDALYLPETGRWSTTASLRASFGIIKDDGERMDAYVAASGEYEPSTEKKWWRLGLVVPLFGGGSK